LAPACLCCAVVWRQGGAQHTAVSLFGLGFGFWFAQVANASPRRIWVAYATLTVVHLLANYAAMKVRMESTLGFTRRCVVVLCFSLVRLCRFTPSSVSVRVGLVACSLTAARYTHVQVLALRSLNRSRLDVLVPHFLRSKSGEVLDPRVVAKKEAFLRPSRTRVRARGRGSLIALTSLAPPHVVHASTPRCDSGSV
jgi:hypothetical protein